MLHLSIDETALTNGEHYTVVTNWAGKGKKSSLVTPGSGKSYFVIRHMITQRIHKRFTMFVCDFKFDDLSKIAHNTWLKTGTNLPRHTNVDGLIAISLINSLVTCLRAPDFSQIHMDCGKEQADVIMNITRNIISGQVTGDIAKQLSERFGRIMQDRESLSINRANTL